MEGCLQVVGGFVKTRVSVHFDESELCRHWSLGQTRALQVDLVEKKVGTASFGLERSSRPCWWLVRRSEPFQEEPRNKVLFLLFRLFLL